MPKKKCCAQTNCFYYYYAYNLRACVVYIEFECFLNKYSMYYFFSVIGFVDLFAKICGLANGNAFFKCGFFLVDNSSSDFI